VESANIIENDYASWRPAAGSARIHSVLTNDEGSRATMQLCGATMQVAWADLGGRPLSPVPKRRLVKMAEQCSPASSAPPGRRQQEELA
jgi:hypothetical protein